MEASELQRLQAYLGALGSEHLTALRAFVMDSSPGFKRIRDEERDEMSEVSTATAVISICHAHGWEAWLDLLSQTDTIDLDQWTAEALQQRLLDPKAWRSRSFWFTPPDEDPEPNPYHVAFTTEAALALRLPTADGHDDRFHEAAVYLKEEVERESKGDGQHPPSEKGAISVQFPPSAHLTQLAIRVLRKIDQALGTAYLTEIEGQCLEWARRRLVTQMALRQAGSRTADPYEIAYSVLIIASFGLATLTPDEKRLVTAAMDDVFKVQRDDGLWPLSHPLFVHLSIGTAYSYEYEMLSQLLQEPELEEHLLGHLPSLTSAAHAVRRDYYNVGGSRTWSSGHIPQQPSPESWATASVYQFVYDLGRLAAEATRRALFAIVGAEYQKRGPSTAPSLLDAPLPGGDDGSLMTTIDRRVIEPLIAGSAAVKHGEELPSDVPVSVILYGPPGTAKTTMATVIAKRVGWPLIKIDPSHVVGQGLDRIQESANAIFGLVARSEAVVVLLDEFDELMRDREEAQSELVSRFLTTAMLPKLATINDARRVFFVVATNHLDYFDAAIKRRGRFDALIPMLAPSVETKLAHWGAAAGALSYLDGTTELSDSGRFMAANLTFGEFGQLIKEIEGELDEDSMGDSARVHDILTRQWKLSAAYQYLLDKANGSEGGLAKALDDIVKMARLPPARHDPATD